MEISFYMLVILPVGLGLLGFIEPCTIGGHLLFLETQRERTMAARLEAVSVFITARALVSGLAGGVIAYSGSKLITMQTGFWMVFGLVYLVVGLTFISGRTRFLKFPIALAPAAWKRASNPLVMGLAFGLNIPACAAPILFTLLGLAATSGTALTGFFMMALFGLFLSLPLLGFALNKKLAEWLDRVGQRLKGGGWIIGLIFVVLGVWSIWFGLYVDPANWAGM